MAFNPYYGYTPQYGKTPYYMQQPITTPQYQTQASDYMQNIQPAYQKPIILQGKSVDNIEVVKATDIPLDGSISYFPLVDGSAIVTKQLQADGTSRMVVYKPVETQQPKQVEEKETYITEKELDEKLSKLDNKELKEEIEKMKKQIKDLMSNTTSTKSK